jgi:hypothetical protein
MVCVPALELAGVRFGSDGGQMKKAPAVRTDAFGKLVAGAGFGICLMRIPRKAATLILKSAQPPLGYGRGNRDRPLSARSRLGRNLATSSLLWITPASRFAL